MENYVPCVVARRMEDIFSMHEIHCKLGNGEIQVLNTSTIGNSYDASSHFVYRFEIVKKISESEKQLIKIKKKINCNDPTNYWIEVQSIGTSIFKTENKTFNHVFCKFKYLNQSNIAILLWDILKSSVLSSGKSKTRLTQSERRDIADGGRLTSGKPDKPGGETWPSHNDVNGLGGNLHGSLFAASRIFAARLAKPFKTCTFDLRVRPLNTYTLPLSPKAIVDAGNTRKRLHAYTLWRRPANLGHEVIKPRAATRSSPRLQIGSSTSQADTNFQSLNFEPVASNTEYTRI